MLAIDDIHALSATVSGTVALPDSPEFAAETLAFNAATVHRPDVVLGAANARDVAAGVKWAAAQRLPVAVQSTGTALTPWWTVACSSTPVACRGFRSIRSNAPHGWEPA